MVHALDGAAFAAIMANLRIDFIERGKERLLAMQDEAAALAGADTGRRDAVVLALLREAHSLKGTGGSFGFPSITVIAHRLEDYLANGGARAESDGVHQFLDVMQDILESGRDPDAATLARLLAGLPGRYAPVRSRGSRRAPGAPAQEALIVTPSRTIDAVIGQHLRDHGFRVSSTASGFEALQLSLRAPPALMVASAVTRDIGGADLARAFGVISALKRIPVLLLTSLATNSPEFAGLPSHCRMAPLDNAIAAVVGNFIGQAESA